MTSKDYILLVEERLNDIDKGSPINIELVEEKFGDIINYFIIQEIMIKNKFTTPF